MKVIIPMAGRGTRLRPHTLNIPKPLLKLSGKSIIEWIVEEIKVSTTDTIDEIHFIIGDFGADTEKMLLDTANSIGSKGFIHYQLEPLGTGHALYCAKDALDGNVFVAFADTIFKGQIKIDSSVDGIIWTMKVEHPEKYGVVKTDSNYIITDFIEKPKNFISNNAIVGLYYFKNAEKLKVEIEDLVENNRRENNELQLTNCLESLKKSGNKLKCEELDEWLDCGNREELLATNRRLIEISGKGNSYISVSSEIINSEVEQYVSIENNVIIKNSSLKNCIVYDNSVIENCQLRDSIIGRNCTLKGLKGRVYSGDYSDYEI
jgi:glucose-1-phosphate thymidylyltransferase